MTIIQGKLVNAYATLVMAERMTIEEVPETKLIGGVELPIRSEVEIVIAERTIDILG
jgi:hypothetical protein